MLESSQGVLPQPLGFCWFLTSPAAQGEVRGEGKSLSFTGMRLRFFGNRLLW